MQIFAVIVSACSALSSLSIFNLLKTSFWEAEVVHISIYYIISLAVLQLFSRMGCKY